MYTAAILDHVGRVLLEREVSKFATPLIYIYFHRNEEKYKVYERLKDGLDQFLAWCRETKVTLDSPPRVLIQLKEVSRLKAQRQVSKCYCECFHILVNSLVPTSL